MRQMQILKCFICNQYFGMFVHSVINLVLRILYNATFMNFVSQYFRLREIYDFLKHNVQSAM